MVVIDTLARALTSVELPLSILTGIIGAPFYIIILARTKDEIIMILDVQDLSFRYSKNAKPIFIM